MADDSDYGNVQQPEGPYGGAGESTSSYAGSHAGSYADQILAQKGPATAPASSPAPAQEPSPQTIADAMVDTMAAIYRKLYSVKKGRNTITLGPKVGTKIPVKLVVDGDMTTAITVQATNIGKDIIQATLKFNPQSVLDQLTKYYKTLGEPLPAYLNKTIDENTVLQPADEAVVFGVMKAALIAEARKDVDETEGFFMLPQSVTDTGTIVVRAAFAQSLTTPSDLAGTIAHELAHAYQDDGWRDFRRDMLALGMSRTGKLEEGMATFLEDQVVGAWIKTQSIKTPRPRLGYTDDPEVAESAATFVKAVTEEYALAAFFGGWIVLQDQDKPKGTILVGEKKDKKWKWPWP